MEDLTIEILKQIRDELVTTRTTLSGRIDHLERSLGERIDGLEGSLGARIDQTNQRLSTVEVTLLDLAEQQRFVVRHLTALTERDRRLEADVDALRARVDVIERRLG